MGPKLLDSILTIKAGLRHVEMCYSQYPLPPEVLNLISKSFISPSQENFPQNNNEEQHLIEYLDVDSLILF